MYSKLLATGLLSLLIAGQAHADSMAPGISLSTASQDVGEAMTVRQMLSIDATLGLHTEQQRFQDRLKAAASKNPRMDSASGAGVIMTPPDEAQRQVPAGVPTELVALTQEQEVPAIKKSRPALVGVFGLGKHLYADVMIDDARYRFESGKSLPAGVSPDFEWRLEGISAPCVVLSNSASDQKQVKTCISPVSEVLK